MMFTLIVLGILALFAWRFFDKKKREAEGRTRTVDFYESDIRPVNRRLPWKDL
jgi:predicted negative regulator of RcsB-dependent stress response